MSKAAEFFKQATEDSTLKAALKAAVQKATNKDEEIKAVTQIAKNAGYDVSAVGKK